jgi:hypothetical protein
MNQSHELIGREKIYIHRERGFAVISKNDAKRIAISAKGEGKSMGDFLICWADIQETKGEQGNNFGAMQVCVYWKGEFFGKLNWKTGKIYFDTTRGLLRKTKELEEKLNNEKLLSKPLSVKHKYVEVCARFPREFYEKALKAIENCCTEFRTPQTLMIQKKHDSTAISHFLLAKNLMFKNHLLNLKAYLAVKCSSKNWNENYITGEDLTRQPKIEVQIAKMGSLKTALDEAIPIIVALLHAVGTHTLEMTEEIYELVRSKQDYQKPYQKIIAHLKDRQSQFNVFYVDENIAKGKFKRQVQIMQAIKREPLCKKEIEKMFGMTINTVTSDLKALMKNRMIYERGRNGIVKMYANKKQIDIDFITRY